MPVRDRLRQNSTKHLASTLIQLRKISGLTQSQVATRMGTTQTAIARLERGDQSPTMSTLQSFARSTGFCLEIGFVRADKGDDKTGCILIIDRGTITKKGDALGG